MHPDWLKKGKDPKTEENFEWLSEHCSECCAQYSEESYQCSKGCQENYGSVCEFLDQYLEELGGEQF